MVKRWWLVVVAVASLLTVGTALAHERIVSGDYALTLGWLDEPPIVGLKNAALVEVTTTKGDQPVAGAEGSLTTQIVYGGKSKELLLRPLEGQPGVYVGDFIPTRRGTYTLKLGGTINGQAVDVSHEIEEVGTTDNLTFPEPQADLQKSIDALQSELSTTRILAIVGLVLAVAAILGIGWAVTRKKSG